MTSSAPEQFRTLLKRPGIIRSLGAHDVFSALIMEKAGLECVFIGGFGTSASLVGLPDLNFLSASEMADAIRRMTARLSIPVIADGDTGHGDVPQIARTVQLFEQAGAAGIILEDQVMPKRCGHFAGKDVVSRDEMVVRIKTAVAARVNPEFVIVTRTDARATLGLDEAIDRVNRACEIGADIAFIEAPHNRTELERISKEVPYPLFANMLTGGATPILSADELEGLGYKIVVCPVETLMVTARALIDLCEAWKTKGRIDNIAAQAMSFNELKDLLDLDRYISMRDTLR